MKALRIATIAALCVMVALQLVEVADFFGYGA